jgi:hypothetical protein
MTSSTAHTYGTNQSSGLVNNHAEKTGSVSGHQLVMYPASFVKVDMFGGAANQAVNSGSPHHHKFQKAMSAYVIVNAGLATNIGSVSADAGHTYIASFNHVYLFRTYCMYLWSANSI